ncbi:uncharacterized protein [Solanum tuberosum]|uniref:uncharacterized protein n=1 Tax=Solanum tuberosum TaxID=4113 RepID=UPI00073A48E7|nr:PREDICTED: uncharacterized protein LOC107059300 [Solanum tuberosum]
MTTLFHDMIHKEIEVYVDDVIIKSKKGSNHLNDLRKFFARLRRYNLKLNPAKCVFGVPAGKVLGFIVSRRGIELDPSKIKVIRDLPPPRSNKEVMSFLGRLNYISRFIAQSTVICEPIFKLLKKDAAVKWTDECQQAFDKIKENLSNPSVLVPPESGRLLLLYISVLDNAFSCILGQHDETGKKEQAIYYISKKFTSYEAQYSLLERTCCALTWVSQKLRHYLSSYTTYLISRMDPLKYIFQKPMPTGSKGNALADHMAENPVDDDYRPLKTYFPDEEVAFVGEDISEEYEGWRMFFDGAKNLSGFGIRAVLISPTGQHYPISAKLRAPTRYRLGCLGNADNRRFRPIDSSATYYFHVEEEPDGKPWYDDIRRYLKSGEYTEDATSVQKRTIRRLANQFFLSGETLYRRTPDLGLLRCVEAGEANRLIEEIHAGTCGPHTNDFTLAKKILRSGYFWLTMETDSWVMDVIGPIEPAATNGHRFILVAIDYFTKWVEATSHKSVTKKVVDDFVKNNIICRFGIPESIITDNGTNLNSDLMKSLSEKFKINHRNSTK